MTTQRLQIREECYSFDKYGLPKGSILNSREIKRFLCDKNSYVDIKKTLVTDIIIFYLNKLKNKTLIYFISLDLIKITIIKRHFFHNYFLIILFFFINI